MVVELIRKVRTIMADRSTDFIDIIHCDEKFRISVRRVKGARRFTLRVRAANRDVVLTMPPRGRLEDAREFAEQHGAWIGARIHRLPRAIPFSHGSIVPFRGLDHTIVHKPEMRGGVWIETLSESEKTINQICTSGEAVHIDRRIHDFLKKQAKSDIVEAVNRHSSVIGVKPRQISLRDTSSRWGSCSTTGNLNFSWRLILAPSYVLNYLAAHEVAHLRYLNHSTKFWELTRQLCPSTDSAEAWLRAHGAELYRYGKVAE
jgi:predicted metal-dependent hydrolase